MNKDLRKVLLLVVLCVCFAGLILLSNRNIRIDEDAFNQMFSEVKVLKEPPKVELTVSPDNRRAALILYSPGREQSEKYADNLCMVLNHLRIGVDTLPLDQTTSVKYEDYDVVIMASSHWGEEMRDSTIRLIDYAERGGKLLLGILPEKTEESFQSIYRQLGIVDYGEYVLVSSLAFEKDLIPGISHRVFQGEDFQDFAIGCTLENSADVYIWGEADAQSGQQIPIFWTYDIGEGRVAVYNGTGIVGDFWRGIAAGCINSLFDTTMYPIVNACSIFVDDFPSPLYDAEFDLFQDAYNRTLQEFYRDIWWPDMLQTAHQYNDVYTCLYVTSYDNEVEAENFAHANSRMELYFGNSLLQNGYEMGMHGYNHQPLTLEGGTPEELDYVPWKDADAMRAAVREYMEIAESVFPSVSVQTYVPPSNYLSQEGRTVLAQELPDLKIIAGVYSNEGELGDVYVQDFTIAEDGIAEFPRITSGMVPGDYDELSVISAMGLHGVFSHFIHPDDILDPERSKEQTWEVMLDAYRNLMRDVHETYPFLRPLAATNAADALRISDSAEPYLDVSEDEIQGSIDGFLGDTYFYLKTTALPRSVDSSCAIEKASNVQDSDYYLVTVKSPNFTIKLVSS